jgi:hypothetical protein
MSRLSKAVSIQKLMGNNIINKQKN